MELKKEILVKLPKAPSMLTVMEKSRMVSNSPISVSAFGPRHRLTILGVFGLPWNLLIKRFSGRSMLSLSIDQGKNEKERKVTGISGCRLRHLGSVPMCHEKLWWSVGVRIILG